MNVAFSSKQNMHRKDQHCDFIEETKNTFIKKGGKVGD